MLLRILKVAITARDSVTRDCTLIHNTRKDRNAPPHSSVPGKQTRRRSVNRKKRVSTTKS